MPRHKKISPSGKLGLNKKQKTQAASKLSSAFKIPEDAQAVNISDLFSPQRILVCWLCGSDRDVLTVHKAGGVLGVCVSCNGGRA